MFPANYILFLQIILFLFITPGTPRIVIFPAGVLEEAELWIRLIVITISIIVFFITKKKFSLSHRFISYTFVIIK